MGLIDSSAIVHVQLFDEEHEEYLTKQMTVERMIEEYTDDNVPTVEAIPIDWIKKRIEDLYEYIGKRGGLFGQEAVANAKIHEVNVLVRLIADWREERKEE